MPAEPATYDLMLLLDTAAPDELRKKVLSDVESLVGRQGTIVGQHDWGTRTLAYEIRHHADAEYHLLQFHGGAELLGTLDRTLRIADGVLRFRIVKLAAGTPAPPEVRPEPRPAAAEAAPGGGEAAASEATADEAAPSEAAPGEAALGEAAPVAAETPPAESGADASAGGDEQAPAPEGEPAAS